MMKRNPFIDRVYIEASKPTSVWGHQYHYDFYLFMYNMYVYIAYCAL